MKKRIVSAVLALAMTFAAAGNALAAEPVEKGAHVADAYREISARRSVRRIESGRRNTGGEDTHESKTVEN